VQRRKRAGQIDIGISIHVVAAQIAEQAAKKVPAARKQGRLSDMPLDILCSRQGIISLYVGMQIRHATLCCNTCTLYCICMTTRALYTTHA
jgi:hypothetical protein